MEFNESQITEKQLAELCTFYENKSKIARTLIRGSLSERQKIKAKIVEDKERASSLLQILERLDEYEKVIRIQLEAVEKMEDPESLKKLEIIKKYESMVREQRDVWAKYEEEYEQLPMAKERRKVQLQLLKTSIQVKLLNYKIEEKKKMINLKKQISKRKEQLAIINFAKFMVEHQNREKHYRELRARVNALKKKEQELRLEVQQLEQLNINRDNKINVFEKQTRMTSLPAMDLSCYIVSQENIDKNCQNADTVSMYSFTLEQEYMNIEGDDVGQASAKLSKMEESNSQNNESQELNGEVSMEINSEELFYEMNQENVVPPRGNKDHSNVNNEDRSKKNSQDSAKKSSRDASKKRASQNQSSEDFSNYENIRDEQRDNRIRTERPVPTPAKMSKQAQAHEGYTNSKNAHRDSSNTHHTNGRTQCSPEVAAKVHDWQRSASPKMQNMNRESLRQQQQAQLQLQQEKLQRQQLYQEQQQQRKHQQRWQKLQQQQQRQLLQHQQQPQPQQQRQQQHPSTNLDQNTDGQNIKQDSSKKPLIKSNERVHFVVQHIAQQQMSHQAMKQPEIASMDTSSDEILDAPPELIQQSHSASNQNKPPTNVQLVTPQYSSINAESMMSVNINMYSSDTNMSADNISAIIGSDITEPGGTEGLIKHIHGDTDDMSDDVELNFSNIMSKFCSPLLQENSNLQQESIHHGNNQSSIQFNEMAANHDQQEHENKNFAFVQFAQKNQSNPSQRFF